MNNIIISDLDGCIANTESLEQKCMASGKWDQSMFNKECEKVLPDEHILDVIYQLQAITKSQLYIVTARHTDIMNETMSWLKKHNVQYDQLFMNYKEPNPVDFKRGVTNQYLNKGDVIKLAIDDKYDYIEMYKQLGVPTWHYTNNTSYDRLEE